MKIIFDSVEIKNFLSCGDVPQKVTFTEGLNLITGENGVGKTSLVDSVSFALFGKTSKDVKQEELINYKNRKDCVVTLNFVKGQSKYKVIRGLKPNFLSIYENDEDISERLDKRDSQATLEEILGIDYLVFSNLTYTNVNDLTPILKMSKPQKRAFIEKLFDIQIFTKLQEKCKDKIKGADKKNLELSNEKKTNLTIISEYRNIIEDLKEQENKESIKDEVGSLKEEISKLEEDLKEFKIKTLQDNLFDNKVELTSIQEAKSSASGSLSTATSLLSEFKTQKESLEEESEESIKDEVGFLEKEISNLNNILKQSSIPDLEDKFIEDDKKLEEYIKEDKILTNNLTELQYEINSDYKEEKRIKEKIKLLEETKECPTCNQEVDPKYIAKKFGKELVEIRKKINRNENKKIELQEELSEVETKKKILESQNTKISDNLRNLKTTEIERDNKKKELTSLIRILDKEEETKKTKKKKIKELTELIEQKEISIIDYNARILKYNKKIEDLESVIKYDKEQIDKYNEIKEDIDDKTKELFSLNRILEQEKKNKQEAETKIKDYGIKIKELKNKNEEIIKEINKLNSLLDYLNCIKDVCKDEKIKQHVISSSLPMINKYTNDYLSKVGFRFYLEIDKFIDAVVKGPGIFGNSTASLSGGEMKSVDTALMIALHDVMRIKAKNHMDILFMDEILDSSVSGSNIGKILDIIKVKQQKDKLKVYIISHRNEIQDLDFDKVLSITKERGYSKIDIS